MEGHRFDEAREIPVVLMNAIRKHFHTLQELRPKSQHLLWDWCS